MFFGIYPLSLKNNKELNLPNALRETMGGTVYLTRGFDNNLLLMPHEAFQALTNHIQSTSITDPASRQLRRLFLAGAARMSLQERGRVELPAELCAYAGLEKEITLVGQGDYLEVWSASEWAKQVEILSTPDTNNQRFEKFNLTLD